MQFAQMSDHCEYPVGNMAIKKSLRNTRIKGAFLTFTDLKEEYIQVSKVILKSKLVVFKCLAGQIHPWFNGP